ncbi:PREDICTED: titin-like [Ceratosolen solmsi marchali]|uniref:Titin-like n=1 Tax=Ceratosolen solmsi marchali TaxID=326594 RepID=A0AAJ6YDK4_9HYME|nr:PREDICTED: titin-like [Ceratosolen solmsi marchali]
MDKKQHTMIFKIKQSKDEESTKICQQQRKQTKIKIDTIGKSTAELYIEDEKSSPELSPVKLPENLVEEQSVEETHLPWLRGKKKPKKVEEIETKPEDIRSVVLKTTKRRIKPEDKKEIEEIKLKPTEKMTKPTKSKDDIPLKPVKQTTSDEISKEIGKDTEDVEMQDDKVVEEEKIEETTISWRVGKKKPEKRTVKENIEDKKTLDRFGKSTAELYIEDEKSSPALSPVKLPENEVEEQSVEETHLPWLRGKKKPKKVEEIETKPEDIRSVVLKTTKRRIKPEDKKEIEEIKLKPTEKMTKPTKSKDDIPLKPVKQTTSDEISKKIGKDTEDVEMQDDKVVEEEKIEETTISWRVGKKKPEKRTVKENIEDKKTLDRFGKSTAELYIEDEKSSPALSPVKLPENEVEEQSVEETHLPWLRGKKKPKKVEEIETKPEDIRSVVLKTTKSRIKPEDKKEIEEIKLKPTEKMTKPTKSKDDIPLKPVKQTTSDEISKKIGKDTEDVEMQDDKVVEEEKIEETTISWRVGKKKPEKRTVKENIEDKKTLDRFGKSTAELYIEDEKSSPALSPVKLPENEVEEQSVEETHLPWLRGKKKPKKVEEIETKPEDIRSVVLKTTKSRIKPEDKKEIEEIKLKPTEKMTKPTKSKDDIPLKPVKQTTSDEISKKIGKDTEDVEMQDDKVVEEEKIEETTISWRVGKKKPEKRTVKENIEDKKTLDRFGKSTAELYIEDEKSSPALSPVKLPENEVEEQSVEETHLPWLRGKKKSKKIVEFQETVQVHSLDQTKLLDVVDSKIDRNVNIVEMKQEIKQKEQTELNISKNITSAPQFIQKLQPLICESNKPAKFSCKVIGNPIPKIAWYKNEKELHANEKYLISEVETTAVLEIKDIIKEDVGRYTCTASNLVGVATSTVNLIILDKEEEGIAAHFSNPIKPVVVEENKPAIFQCTVKGNPTPELKWYRDETEIKPKRGITEISFIPETGESKLIICKPTFDDEAIYRVRALNKFGRAECRTNLLINNAAIVMKPEILHAPKIIEPLPAVVAQCGKSLTLTVKFESDSKPEIKWFKNNVEITSSSNKVIRTFENVAELYISEVEKKDTGKYEIRVQNSIGEARSSGSVSIKDKGDKIDEAKAPKFIQPIQPHITTLGEVVIMETTVESYPTASFQWFHECQPLKTSHEIRIVSKENRSVLMIKEIKPESIGTYTCRAENVIGSVTSTATISFQEIQWEKTVELISPTFIKKLSPICVMDGESVNLTCVIQGKPIPKVEWFHDKKPIKEGKQITILQDSEGVCNLAISEVFPEDAGEYTCHAINTIGEAVCSASLIVEAYEYIPDSEIASSAVATSLTTGQSESEEDFSSPKVMNLFNLSF